MDAAVFRGGVHVTVAYFAVFFAAVVLQAYYKLSFKALAKKKGERYNRYTDERMLVIDRIVGNQLEWAPMFLSLFWLATTAVQGGVPTLGWAYVVTRVLYIPLVFMGGIGTSGPKNLILLSTVPGYVCLMALATQLLRAV